MKPQCPPAPDPPAISGFPSALLGSFTLDTDDARRMGCAQSRHLHVFGAKVFTGEEWQGVALFRNELLVIEELPNGERRSHHLAQHDSALFTTTGAPASFEAGDMLPGNALRILHRPPRWNHAEASIPLHEGKPFWFVGQLRARFGTGQTVYLFAVAPTPAQLMVQAFLQDTSEQTAEKHYRLEEQMSEFDACYKDLAAVEALIRNGDTLLHDYIAGHPRSSHAVLELLLRHTRSKALKHKIEARLAS